METRKLDRVAQIIRSRRHVLGAALGGAAMLGLPGAGSAKKKSKKCKPKKGRCICKPGELCLGNGDCTLNCAAAPCPSGCTCNSTPAGDVCEPVSFECESLRACATTANCPKGTVCRPLNCTGGGDELLCVPLCAA